MQRGGITKQGSRIVRWAAVESVQILPVHTRTGAVRDRVAARRGRNIGIVAAARTQLELVYYALRDHHVRALHRAHREVAYVPDHSVGAGRAVKTPAARSPARSSVLIDPDRPSPRSTRTPSCDPIRPHGSRVAKG